MRNEKLVIKLSEKTKKSKKDVALILDELIEEISMNLWDDQEVRISGLGTFYTVFLSARNGSNPRTGKPMTIPDMHIVRFRAGSRLKKTVAQ